MKRILGTATLSAGGGGGGGWRWFGKWIREVSLVAINGDFSLEHGLEMSLVSRYRANQI